MCWTHHMRCPPPLNCLNIPRALPAYLPGRAASVLQHRPWLWPWFPGPWSTTRRTTKGRPPTSALFYLSESLQFYCVFTTRLNRSLSGCMLPKYFNLQVLWFDSTSVSHSELNLKCWDGKRCEEAYQRPQWAFGGRGAEVQVFSFYLLCALALAFAVSTWPEIF